MTTGMTTAERWVEVAQRVWGGAFFGDAVFGVFWENGILCAPKQELPAEFERRSSWNAKLADGMRKWADWVEARF